MGHAAERVGVEVDVDLVTFPRLERLDVVRAGRPHGARQQRPGRQPQGELVAVDPHRLLRRVHDVSLDEEPIAARRRRAAPRRWPRSRAPPAPRRASHARRTRSRSRRGSRRAKPPFGMPFSRISPPWRAPSTWLGARPGRPGPESCVRRIRLARRRTVAALRCSRLGSSAVHRLQHLSSRAQVQSGASACYAEVVFHVAVR